MAGMRLVATGGALAPASPAGSQSLSALAYALAQSQALESLCYQDWGTHHAQNRPK